MGEGLRFLWARVCVFYGRGSAFSVSEGLRFQWGMLKMGGVDYTKWGVKGVFRTHIRVFHTSSH